MDSNTPPPLQTAPPPPPKSKWPTIVGIIALVFGILGLLGSLVGIVNPIVMRAQMESAVKQGVVEQGAVDAFLAEFTKFQWTAIPVGFVLGAILAAGGFLLLKRKTGGPPVLKLWSILKILGGGYLLYKGSILSGQQFEILLGGNAAGTSQAEMAGKFASIFTKVAMVSRGVWLIALPLFLLIWLGRSKIKDDVAEW